MRIYLLLILILPLSSKAQKQEHTVLFYNIENLFDTLDTEGKDDVEFLPDSKNAWNSAKYNEKIAHINTVIEKFDKPLIVGMCEIENAQVVHDVVNFSELKGKYGVVHFESLDNRGIDNAIIYDSLHLQIADKGIIRFNMPGNSGPSRDIVWAKFVRNNRAFYVFVNHWPSRRGGQVESEPKRLIAANAARAFVDSLLTTEKKAKIVFMGDLNDTPEDNAPKLISSLLEPMIAPASGEFGGSHNYQGEWSVLDHILVSSGFKKGKGYRVKKDSGKINSFDFLLTEYKGQTVPFRTYGGGKYLGGYSDHLPVSITLRFK